MAISAIKTVVHPALMAIRWLALGLRGLHFTVMLMAAAMPVGTNVYLFSQCYYVSENLVTTRVAASIVMELVTISVVMSLLLH